MKIFLILFFCLLGINSQKVQSLPQQGSTFFNCSEEDRRTCLKRAQDRVQLMMEHVEDSLENLKQNLKDTDIFKDTTVEDICRNELAAWRKFIELIQKSEQEDSSFEKLIKVFFEDRFLLLFKIEVSKKREPIKNFSHLMLNEKIFKQNCSAKQGVYTCESLNRDRMEILEKLIVDILSLTTLHKLPYDIKHLIAASPSLHSKIQGLEDPWNDASHYQDTLLYRDHIYLIDLEIDCYAGFYKFQKEFPMTIFEHQKIMGIAPGEKRISPLKIPDFLKDSLHTSSASMEPLDELESEAKIKKRIPSKAEKSRKKIETQPIETETEIPQTIPQENDPELVKIAKKIPSQKPELVASKVTVVSQQLEKFESEKPTGSQQPQLKEKHLQTHETIFSAKPNNVSFNAFETLWNVLGGEILSNRSGGSHRVLKWNGQTIGGTYVPHGGNDYGPRSIRSLREALSAIGWGSEKLGATTSSQSTLL